MNREYFNDKVTISDEARRLYKKRVSGVEDSELNTYNIEEVKPEAPIGFYFFLFFLTAGVAVGSYVVAVSFLELIRKALS